MSDSDKQEQFQAIYGEFEADGLVREPSCSILTFRPIFPPGTPTVRERVPGTDYFYRYEAERAEEVTAAQREEWRRGANPRPSAKPTPYTGHAGTGSGPAAQEASDK